MIFTNKRNLRIPSAVILSVSVLLSVFLIVIAGLDYYEKTNENINRIIDEHLVEMSDRSADAFNVKLKELENNVNYTAQLLSVPEDAQGEFASVFPVLQKLKQAAGFPSVYFCDENGRFFDSSGQMSAVGDAPNFLEDVMQGRSGVSDVFYGKDSANPLCAVYAPVKNGGRPVGGVIGIYAVRELIGSTFSFDYGYCNITDSSGKVIIKGAKVDEFSDGDNLFAFLSGVKVTSITSAEQMRTDMQQQQNGALTYRGSGKDGSIIYYSPIHINNWYVVTVTADEIISGYTDSFNYIAWLMAAKITAAFLIIILMTLYLKARSRKDLVAASMEIQKSNKLYEMVIEHTEILIFQYDFKEDTVRFEKEVGNKWGKLPETIKNVMTKIVGLGYAAPEGVKDIVALLNKVKKGAENASIDFQGGTAFSEDRWFRLTISPVFSERKTVAYAVGSVKDITDIKNEFIRYAQEEQFRKAMMRDSVCMWSADLTSGKLLNTENIDYTQSDEYDEAFLAYIVHAIHPDSREKIKEFLSIKNLLDFYARGELQLEKRYLSKFGGLETYQWFTTSVNLLKDPGTGNPLVFCYSENTDEQVRREQEMIFASERDHLTHLYNRKTFEEQLVKLLLSESQKESTGISALMVMDLDGFKEVNDRYGHQIGDEVLKIISGKLRAFFLHDGIVGRLGGDEFTAFVTGVVSEKELLLMGGRLCAVIEETAFEGVDLGDMSISIGIAVVGTDGRDFATLYENADAALYAAKSQGKCRAVLYESGMNGQVHL